MFYRLEKTMEAQNFKKFLLVFILGVLLINMFFELVITEYLKNIDLNVINYFVNVAYGFVVFFLMKKKENKKTEIK